MRVPCTNVWTNHCCCRNRLVTVWNLCVVLTNYLTIYKVNTYPNEIYKYRFDDSDATKHLEVDGEGSADGPVIPPDYDTSKAAAKGIAKSNVLQKIIKNNCIYLDCNTKKLFTFQ